MKNINKWIIKFIFLIVQIHTVSAKKIEILNVSYDPTREFYVQYNKAFAEHYKKKTGYDVIIRQSHGGSGKQAASVINGMKADIVTLAVSSDIDEIAKHGSIKKNWMKRFKNHSSPYSSTIVFLVRKSNPKNIKDWIDLIKPKVSVITPNPKSSGGAKWNYLAAWGYALKTNNNNQKKAEEFVTNLFKNVDVQDSGARSAASTFFEREVGDVLISWESDAYFTTKKLGKNNVEIITPSQSIFAQPVVSIVDKIVDEKNSRNVANEYLEYLYSFVGQSIAVKHYYRPHDLTLQKQCNNFFPSSNLFTIDEMFGNWETAKKIHFSEGGTYDKIMMAIKKS